MGVMVMKSKVALADINLQDDVQLQLIDEMTLGVLITNFDDHILFANRSCCQMLGYAEIEMVGQDAKSLLFTDAEEVARMLRHTQRHLRGVSDTYVVRLRHHAGHEVWVRVHGAAIHDDDDVPVGTIGVLQDITRQRDIEHALQRRNQELADLVALQHELSAQMTLAEVATTAVNGVLRMVHADFAILMQRQGEMLQPLKVQFADPDLPPKEFSAHRIGECFCGLAAKRRQPVYAIDQAQDERCSRANCLMTSAHSLVALPLVGSDQVTGVISIGSFAKRDFRLQEDYLTALSGEIALGLQRANQFETEQKLRQRSEVMRRIATALSSSLDLQRVLDSILTQLATVIPYDSASIYLHEGNEARMIACRGFSHPEAILGKIFFANTYFEQTIRQTQRPLIVPDATADPRFTNWGGEYSIRGWVLTPLLVRGQVIGSLSIDSRTPNFYQPDHALDAAEFAYHAAVAIENAQLYDKVQRYAAELEQRVAQRTTELQERVSVVEKMNKAMLNVMEDLQASRQQMAFYARNLEQANDELQSFSYSVSHDLRAPLRHITGFSQLLAMEYRDQLDETAHSYLNALQESSLHMDNLIQGLLAFSRLGRKALRVQQIEPGDVIEAVWAKLQDPASQRQIELRVGDLPPCAADPLLLEQVYSNLLSNAVKYTGERKHAIIEVGYRADVDGGAYFVKDNGAGFDMRYADKLFGIFQRLHSDEEFEGVGVGLAIVQRIINKHGGRIWARAVPDQGATFYFSLPTRSISSGDIADA